MNRNRILALLAVFAVASLPAHATKYVDKNNAGCQNAGPGTQPVPYCSIQVGYNNAADGEQVLVAPGTYGECLFLFDLNNPKNVSIVATAWLANPPNNTTTIIDGSVSGACTFPQSQNPASQVNLAGTGASGSTLQGFTIRNAANSAVFGVGSVAITNNVIRDSASPTYGGGIYIYTANCYYGDTAVTIANNTVTNNDATQGGGGIAIAAGLRGVVQDPVCTLDGDATVTVQSNTITGNSAQASGGGVNVTTFTNSARVANVAITQNMITGNSAGSATVYGYGGGVYTYTYGYGAENVDVTNNTIADNTAADLGGGLSVSSVPNFVATTINHQTNVDDNVVTGNTGQRGGGGIELFVLAQDVNAPQTVQMSASSNTVTGNQVTLDNGLSQPNFRGGGGFSAQLYSLTSSSPTLGMDMQNNRISNNSSRIYAGGVSMRAVADGDIGGAIAPASARIGFNGNRVTQNSATSSVTDATGGGIFAYFEAEGAAGNPLVESTATINMDRNTVSANTLDNTVEVGGIHVESLTVPNSLGDGPGLSVMSLTNSIVSGNDGVGFGGPSPGQAGLLIPAGVEFNFDTSQTTYDDFFGNDLNFDAWITPGVGTLLTDPLLDATTFVPSKCSPTIDAANPALDFSLEPRPNGGRANMGHTGGTDQATSGLADVSGDGSVDGIDVGKVAVAFGSSTAMPRYDASVDFDSNGLVDGNDLAILAGDFGVTCP